MKVVWGFLTVCFFASFSFAQCPEDRIIEGRYILSLKDNRYSNQIQTNSLDNLAVELELLGANVKIIHHQERSQSLVHTFDSKMEVPASILVVESDLLNPKELKKDPRVAYLENDCEMDLFAVPNDPQYNQQWSHQRINSESGWEIETGNAEVIVAVSDTGVDYNHTDLRNNMWINENEMNGAAGVDDDGNGCIDDIYGCDTANGDGDPKPGGDHGTHVAGIIGAVGNNGNGVSGVAWTTRIMAAKGFRDGQAGGALSELLASVYYAADNGARVVNCSWGGESSPPRSTRDAFQYAVDKGVVPVVAAGNSTKNSSGFSPAGLGFVLTVGASGSNDQLATFSNFGAVVDVIAPGGDVMRGNIPGSKSETIFSTIPGNRYAGMPGTSMAAPHVAGLAALILSRNPSLTVQEVMDIIKNSGKPTTVRASNGARTEYTYPLIDVRAALDMTPEDNGSGDGGGNQNPDDPQFCQENPQLCDASAQGDGVPPVVTEAFSDMGGCSLGATPMQTSNANIAGLLGLLGLPLLLLGFVRRKN